jgi:hypothetical protein
MKGKLHRPPIFMAAAAAVIYYDTTHLAKVLGRHVGLSD